MGFDLLSTVEHGGCSAKLAPGSLAGILAGLPRPADPNLLVDAGTHDDAGVYRMSDDVALIQTVDFFPPVCSDPCTFGRIAATNALSDVYAMGGRALTAMNLVMFPSARIPLEVLADILRGGQESVDGAGAVMVGGHTIDDYPPKYGLSVTGVVHPDRIVTNANARPGDVLILTKPLGTGAIVAGKRLGQVEAGAYQACLESMMQLNREGAAVMQDFGVRAGTDITGFGLLGHAMQMAQSSGVTARFAAGAAPLLDGAYGLVDMGCIPGAAFRNLDYVEAHTAFAHGLDYNLKMLLLDPQTSGGLLMCVAPDKADAALNRLRGCGHARAAVVGDVQPPGSRRVIVDK